jgi:hypothetical protein
MHTHQQSSDPVATIGLDIGKNTFHLVGLDKRGAIVMRIKVSRDQLVSPPPSNSRRSSWISRKLVEARRLSSVAKRDRNCQLAAGSARGGSSLARRSTNTWANSGSYC